MKVEIDVTKAFNGDAHWNVICDAFKIPSEKRYESWVPEAILERVRTYLTGYIARRSIEERENRAALNPLPHAPIADMAPDKQE